MSSRLLLDEMYPPALAASLRDQGHDVLAGAALPELAGRPDDMVLDARCRDTGARTRGGELAVVTGGTLAG
jgi:hypothetical protein